MEGPQDYWLITTGKEEPGIDGGMLQRPNPGAGRVNTIGVASIDVALQQANAQPPFELVQATRDRRRRTARATRGARQAAGIDDRQIKGEVVEAIHAAFH